MLSTTHTSGYGCVSDLELIVAQLLIMELSLSTQFMIVIVYGTRYLFCIYAGHLSSLYGNCFYDL